MTAYLGKLLNNCVHDLRHVMARMRGPFGDGLCRGSCPWLSILQLTHRLEQIDLHNDVIVLSCHNACWGVFKAASGINCALCWQKQSPYRCECDEKG